MLGAEPLSTVLPMVTTSGSSDCDVRLV